MSKINQIQELTQDLLYYCHLYYDLDSPAISDKEYDEKFDTLYKLENEANYWLANSPTRKVQGRVLDCFTKIKHSKPMLSAAKTKDTNEIKKFFGNHKFYCSYKLDGLTLVTRYSNGQFVQAVTRGTGFVGEDVTEQAKMITNLPMTIPYDGELELRGECVISWENFKEINNKLPEPYSHPRNLAAGSIRNLDTNITKDRKLSYVVFECVTDLNDVDGLCNSKYLELKWLEQIGFEVVRCHVGDVDDCVATMTPELYQYPCDGLVFELDDRLYSKSLPATSHHEGCRIALKWKDTVYETILRDVEWTPTRTRIISPVAIFDEIDLDGALTTRATLHNLSIIEQLELGIGDTITVYRSNMVIPKIDDNLTRSNTLVIPSTCPCCGSPTTIKMTNNSKVLMCTNEDCPATRIAQFENFVSRKCMNIEGLSSATLSLLLSHSYLSDFKSIYELERHRNELTKLPGMGAKSVEKLLVNIEKSKDVTLDHFICALGIPNIGASAAKTIAQYCHGNWDEFYTLFETTDDWTFLKDFGQVMSNSMNEYLDNNTDEFIDLAEMMRFIEPKQHEVSDNPFMGTNICVTGKLIQFTRKSINEKIEELGAKPVSSISTKTDYLLCNEASTSTKYKKATELGIPVISEIEFLKMIGENFK